MTDGFTPGPWRFDGDWHRIPTILGPKGQRIASIEKHGTGADRSSHSYQQAANARLIAAAPDLYAALDDILSSCGEATMDGYVENSIHSDEVAKAVAAIAKARGES